MTILPSDLIDAPNLCIFPLYLLSWCVWHSVLGSVGKVTQYESIEAPWGHSSCLRERFALAPEDFWQLPALVSYRCHPSLPLGIEVLVKCDMKRGWAYKPGTGLSPAAISSCSRASQEKQTTCDRLSRHSVGKMVVFPLCLFLMTLHLTLNLEYGGGFMVAPRLRSQRGFPNILQE